MIGGAMFPPCSLAWGQSTFTNIMCLSGLLQSVYLPPSSYSWHIPPPETPEYSQASLAQSLVGWLLLSPGSSCTQGFICAHTRPECSSRYWWLVESCPTWDRNEVLQGVQYLCWSTKAGNIILALYAYDRNFSQLYTSFEINSASTGMVVLFVKRNNKLKHVRDSFVK